ncbi:MAG TPA: sugar phosphate isomerase/epimerase, partial [Terriglobia bacterium]|nr:sugar phosphate isomerase/epimerase [Terriglobia bacterium]
MKVGLFTVLLSNLSLDEVINKIKPLGIQTIELGTGNYPGNAHLKLDLLNAPSKLKEFKQKLDDQGITISALSCHGNPLHPVRKIAEAAA